jgi:hypothetical protein
MHPRAPDSNFHSRTYAVQIDPEAARGWLHGLRLLGSNIPGVLTAGTFYQEGGIVFYDVHDPERTIVLELEHETYKRLIAEVEDPQASRTMIEQAIKKQQQPSKRVR